MVQNESPRDPNGLKKIVWVSQLVHDHFFLKKNRFQPIFNPFTQNSPFSRRYGTFHGPKRVTKGSKRVNTLVSTHQIVQDYFSKGAFPSHFRTTFDPNWPGNNFGKKSFFSPRGPSWTHRWPPTCGA